MTVSVFYGAVAHNSRSYVYLSALIWEKLILATPLVVANVFTVVFFWMTVYFNKLEARLSDVILAGNITFKFLKLCQLE